MAVILVRSVEFLFLVYFLLLNGGLFVLHLIAAWSVRHYMARHPAHGAGIDRATYSGFFPPIGVIVPAFNEEATITTTIHSMMQLHYPSFEVIVVNDGSKDRTLEVAIEEFGLQPFREVHRARLATKTVRGVYRSVRYPNLRFIDKENGGKADALNAGINACVSPLFCGVDADSILQNDSLTKCVLPFLEDRRTICAGGTIRIANGCEVDQGLLLRSGLPRHPLALLQVVEYLRAFLFGRLGWSPMNGLLIVSGAFGLFERETVVQAGGYSPSTIGEDMELVVRLHRRMIEESRPYRITFVPDPICWTEAPESLKVLGSQRTRWQRGLAESLWRHRSLLFRPGSGAVGWFSFPYMLVFECIEPVVEVGGLVFFALCVAFGLVGWSEAVLFLGLVQALGMLQTVNAVLLEEVSYRTFPATRQILTMIAASVLESIGYRQLNTWWRLKGLVQWATGRKHKWGKMTRSAAWSSGASPK
ncbi:MAG: glycosyltransferase [Fibrobacteria bacterium]|nr:glycosyltransferase [Fibrobacteria bacterium]